MKYLTFIRVDPQMQQFLPRQLIRKAEQAARRARNPRFSNLLKDILDEGAYKIASQIDYRKKMQTIYQTLEQEDLAKRNHYQLLLAQKANTSSKNREKFKSLFRANKSQQNKRFAKKVEELSSKKQLKENKLQEQSQRLREKSLNFLLMNSQRHSKMSNTISHFEHAHDLIQKRIEKSHMKSAITWQRQQMRTSKARRNQIQRKKSLLEQRGAKTSRTASHRNRWHQQLNATGDLIMMSLARKQTQLRNKQQDKLKKAAKQQQKRRQEQQKLEQQLQIKRADQRKEPERKCLEKHFRTIDLSQLMNTKQQSLVKHRQQSTIKNIQSFREQKKIKRRELEKRYFQRTQRNSLAHELQKEALNLIVDTKNKRSILQRDKSC